MTLPRCVCPRSPTLQAVRVNPINRIPAHISKRIQPTRQTNRIALRISPTARVVHTMPVVGHAALRIQILTGKTQTQATEVAVVDGLLTMVSQIPRPPNNRPRRIRHRLRSAKMIVADGIHRPITPHRDGHTAIREDASINLEAIDHMLERFPDADIVFIESGGDNLAATFSPQLSDLTIYVIDVAGGEKIPRKGGPGITRSDLLVINKTDLAPHVGANLDTMAEDTRRMRPNRPFVMTSLPTQQGLQEVMAFIERQGMFLG